MDDYSLHTAFSTEHAETPTLNYPAATLPAAAAFPERRVEAVQQPNLDAQQLLKPGHGSSATAACVVVIGVDGEGVPHVLIGPHALLPGRRVVRRRGRSGAAPVRPRAAAARDARG